MASALDSLIARGLDLHVGSNCFGEIFRVRGSLSTFSASLTSQIKPDDIGGRIMETLLCVRRSAFSALPAEGLVIEREDGSESFRVVECRPAAGGYIDVVLRSAFGEPASAPPTPPAVLTWETAGLTWETAGATW